MKGQVINGIIVGTGYALVAMGWTLVFGVLRKLNMAHGAMFMGSAVAAWFAWGVAGGRDHISFATTVLGAVVAVGAGAGAGYLVYLVGFRTLREGTGDLPPIVTTLAIASIATAVAVIYLGSEPRQLTSADFKGSVTILGTPVATIQAVIVAVALVVGLLIILMVQRTAWGRRVRAISESSLVAERAGIRVSRVVGEVFMVSGAIAGIGSYLWMIRVGSVSPFLGQLFLIKGLVVMVIGGLGRVGGAMSAGLVVGVLEGISIAQFSGAYAELVTWSALIVLLLIRPQGLVRSVA